MLNDFVSKRKFALAALGCSTSLFLPVLAFAAEGDTTGGAGGVVSIMTTAFTQIQTDFMSAVAVVGPIAIGIVSVFLLWRYVLRFFKSVSK